MTSLYELTAQQREMKELAIGGDIPEAALKDTFDALGAQFEDKALSLIHVVHDFDSDIEQLDAEIKRLTDRKKSVTNKKERLREYLRTNMEECDITKIECPLFSITLAKGRDVCVIDDESKIPDDLVSVSVTTKPDKAAILRKLKAGDSVQGARVEKSKTSLRIK